jgi:hypothetical protein
VWRLRVGNTGSRVARRHEGSIDCGDSFRLKTAGSCLKQESTGAQLAHVLMRRVRPREAVVCGHKGRVVYTKRRMWPQTSKDAMCAPACRPAPTTVRKTRRACSHHPRSSSSSALAINSFALAASVHQERLRARELARGLRLPPEGARRMWRRGSDLSYSSKSPPQRQRASSRRARHPPKGRLRRRRVARRVLSTTFGRCSRLSVRCDHRLTRPRSVRDRQVLRVQVPGRMHRALSKPRPLPFHARALRSLAASMTRPARPSRRSGCSQESRRLLPTQASTDLTLDSTRPVVPCRTLAG